MNPDLEAALKALDALMEARTRAEAQQRRAIYDSKLEDVLEKNPGLSKTSLHSALVKRYSVWVKKGSKPSSLPPKA
ncbi:MAG: hypothetical protein HYY23_09885 [Verrucomicrobia bacterium]|nr:hypothetical protein [Verrucomicrobiota bacterium]